MDYNNVKKKIVINNFEEVVKLNINIVSGDEILEVMYKDYSTKEYDSSDCRRMDFYDGGYCIYDITKGFDDIKNWNKREDSYDYEEREK